MAELEVDSEDRPIYPPKIIKAEVLSSPFDDIIPRDLVALGIKRVVEKEPTDKPKDDRPQIRKQKYGNPPPSPILTFKITQAVSTRKIGLLSFGDDEVAESVPITKSKMKSSHDTSGETAISSKSSNKGKADNGEKKQETEVVCFYNHKLLVNFTNSDLFCVTVGAFGF